MLSARDAKTVEALCSAFVAGVRDILQAKLAAVYVYGALTFPETTHTGDVDFHVIVAAAPTELERSALLTLHEQLAADYPPLGAELDGYYILESDARSGAPPRHLLFPHLVDDSWALHRAHILAGRVWILFGPDPQSVYAPPTWSELAAALDGELDYVTRHLAQYPAYCVLNLCRLLYSWETQDVVTSKAASASWARQRFPAWMLLIDRALAAYARHATGADDETLFNGALDFHALAEREITMRRPGV